MLFLGWMFGNAGSIGVPWIYVYGGFILLSVFAFTELMDRSSFAVFWEAVKNLSGILLITLRGDWFGISGHAALAKYVMLAYFAISTIVVAWFTMGIWKEDKLRPSGDAAAAYAEGVALGGNARVTEASLGG
jgi:hypothetical protein